MAIDMQKLGLTKRSLVLLGILVVLLVYLFAKTTEPSPPQPVKVATPASSAGAAVGQATPANPARVAAPADQVARDPFQVPAVYRQPNKPPVTEKVSTKAEAMPELLGTVKGTGGSIAILAVAGESRSVRIGEMIGGYTLVAVDVHSVEITGPGGNTTLRVGRQGK